MSGYAQKSHAWLQMLVVSIWIWRGIGGVSERSAVSTMRLSRLPTWLPWSSWSWKIRDRSAVRALFSTGLDLLRDAVHQGVEPRVALLAAPPLPRALAHALVGDRGARVAAQDHALHSGRDAGRVVEGVGVERDERARGPDDVDDFADVSVGLAVVHRLVALVAHRERAQVRLRE